jgi:hypothetical protein
VPAPDHPSACAGTGVAMDLMTDFLTGYVVRLARAWQAIRA